MWKNRTLWFMVATIAAITAWDLIVANTAEQDDSISEQIQILSRQWAFFAFAWAVVSAHLFLTRNWQGYDLERWRYWGLAWATGMAGLASWLLGGPIWSYMVAGIFVGYTCWPQYNENFPPGGQQ